MIDAAQWITFVWTMPFLIIGLVIHILGKYAMGRVKNGRDFRWLEFVRRNWLAWIWGFLFCLVLCYGVSRGTDIGIDAPSDVLALFLGVSGGSLGKGSAKAGPAIKSILNWLRANIFINS